ncbi:MAG: aldo/keto reductase [Chloroflexi bacterium]|nr:aldo/keto reductase [Chloroflexota bacterium]
MSEPNKVKRVPLGASGINIPELGVGVWQWGDSLSWGYGRSYSEADIRGAFEASLARGLDFFDTAEVYGRGESERLLGKLIRESGRTVTVASKFFPFPWRLTRGTLLQALDHSLRRLDLDSIDLYQIHFPTPPVPIETWLAGLADAFDRKLIRAAGISNFNLNQTRRAHATLATRGIPLASNQVSFSLLNRQPQTTGLLDTCRELNVTLIAYSPLAQGLLTGKYTRQHRPGGIRAVRGFQISFDTIGRLIDLMSEIGAGHGGKTPAQVALNWVICKGAVPIPGAKSAPQAEENAGAAGWRLAPDEVAALDAASR